MNEEGSGKLVIRGFGLDLVHSVAEYYDSLPGSFIISSIPGAPTKDSLDRYQRQLISQRLEELQSLFQRVRPRLEGLSLPRESLRDEVLTRLQASDDISRYFPGPSTHDDFVSGAREVISRSEWYSYTQDFFVGHPQGQRHFSEIRAELIDPAYNSLFAKTDEGFLQDDIRYLSGVPEILLDTSIAIRSLRKEISLVSYPIKMFEFISSFGSGELLRYLTDEAIDYVEDKMVSTGHSYMTRKNWFGMYPRMRQFMGLEIK